jgi:hypothetical protein
VDTLSASDFKPPYLSFQTFWGFIQELASKPLPPQIDRSMMDSKSGTDQANLLSTMKSFGLIDELHGVTPFLQQLVKADEIQQKRAFAEVIKLLYPHQFQISAQNGTEKLLYDSFEQDFGVNGDTRRKAVTFFLHAARFAGIDLSPHFPTIRTGASAAATNRPRRTPKRKPVATQPVVEKPLPQATTGDTYTVALNSGGSVSVVVAVNLFDLSSDDREFVISLVDKLKGYTQSSIPDGDQEVDS